MLCYAMLLLSQGSAGSKVGYEIELASSSRSSGLPHGGRARTPRYVTSRRNIGYANNGNLYNNSNSTNSGSSGGAIGNSTSNSNSNNNSNGSSSTGNSGGIVDISAR